MAAGRMYTPAGWRGLGGGDTNYDLFKYNIENLTQFVDKNNAIKILCHYLDSGKNTGLNPDFCKAFQLITPKKYLNLIKKESDMAQEKDSIAVVSEIGRMWRRYGDPSKYNEKQKKHFPEGIKVKNWKTFEELHDFFSKETNKLEALASAYAIPWKTDRIKLLHGAREGKVRILLPRTGATLVRWGNEQRHCISSYAKNMVEKETVLFGVFVDGKLKNCGRIEKDNLVELRSRSNGEVDTSEEASVHKILTGLGFKVGGANGYY